MVDDMETEDTPYYRPAQRDLLAMASPFVQALAASTHCSLGQPPVALTTVAAVGLDH